jgi:hypothetical protein
LVAVALRAAGNIRLGGTEDAELGFTSSIDRNFWHEVP